LRHHVSIRQITSSAAVIGLVLVIASCTSSSSQHVAHTATISGSRAHSSSQGSCGFGALPATASQKAGFADARFAWAARLGFPGFQRGAFFRIAVFDLQTDIIREDGAATTRDKRVYRMAVRNLRQVALPNYGKRSARKAKVYRAAVVGLNRFFGKTRRPTYWTTPGQLDRGCGSGVLPVTVSQKAGYYDARHAWGVSNTSVGDVGGAGQGVFWGVAIFYLRVGLEYDSLTPHDRRAYRTAIHVLRSMSNLPDTGVTRRIAAEYKHDFARLNYFFGTKGYV
jgi:hypothetical protein